MKQALFLLLLLIVWGAPASGGEFRPALPGYRFEFPRDHFSHPDFKTEWWYYTGNLQTREGRRFGFELTFFRQAVYREEGQRQTWDVDQLYLAHFAVSDIDSGGFYHVSRLNRAGPGVAGASVEQKRIWNGNWQAVWEDAGQRLQAISPDFTIHLRLTPRKPPVIHGKDGVHAKAAGAGRASHYISFTRLEAEGEITVKGRKYSVAGLAWMDHEFFTHQLGKDQVGWDWMSIQLEDNSEIMLARLRKQDGSTDEFSSATYIDPQGRTRHLTSREFTATPGEVWVSQRTGARYPIAWTLQFSTLQLSLQVRTLLKQQELVQEKGLGPSYWEGAVIFLGERAGKSISGVGYLEMTGYDKAVKLE